MQPAAFDIRNLAREAMLARGLEPEPSSAAEAEASVAARQGAALGPGVIDQRELLWSSIDNDDSRDLDQIEWGEARPGGGFRLLVGLADVDAFVPKGGALDQHAAANTTTVYTGAVTFPMLPLSLSTGATSLLQDRDRLAIVVDMEIDAAGVFVGTRVYRSLVRNHAKLAYPSVGAWLEAKAPPPPLVANDDALQAQLRLQDAGAALLRARRHEAGALDLDSAEARTVTDGSRVVGVALVEKNRARELVEDLMIAANGAIARFLDAQNVASLRRIVKSPARWPAIVALAATFGTTLPDAPDAPALAAFLSARRAADPLRFADLSLAIVKMLGPGEYVLEHPGGAHEGHFGLAVSDYTHATAPNRRYPDIITQRIIKATLDKAPRPYTDDELSVLAAHCTQKANDAQKVERTVRKAAAAIVLAHRVGEIFEAIVTGVSPKGTYARLLAPPAEGRIMHGEAGLEVGAKVRLRLQRVDPVRGFIDFERA